MNEKHHDNEYLELVERIIERGHQKGDRTGTGTISLPFQQMRFDLSHNSIPLLTTKKMFTRGVIHEILWYLQGETNIKYLVDNDVHIWDEWADENGELGPVYGAQWRRWNDTKITGATWNNVDHDDDSKTIFETKVQMREIDQIGEVIDKLRNNPNDRRIIVSAWNVGEIEEMNLPPCHLLFQFWSRELSRMERMQIDGSGHFDATHEIFDMRGIPRRALSCHLYQRSCDTGLGVPFNIVQYSILTHMIAQVTGHVAEEFVWTGGDVHIYNNHIDKLKEQVTREPFPSPTLKLNPDVKEIDDFRFEDFEIVDYQHHPLIKMEVSV